MAFDHHRAELRNAILRLGAALTNKKTKAVFWLQPTRSFLEGAPQRESYDSDAAFFSACEKYDEEWRLEYECPGCENNECPQCGRKT